MLATVLLTLHTVLASAAMTGNCTLSAPPHDAGETQAHGVILYIYPRSQNIDKQYNGCQTQWFFDEDHYRRLSVVHYENGIATGYDNINLSNQVGYHCQYVNARLIEGNDKRCPQYQQLSKKTYRAGCYSQSKLNSSDSYELAFADCQLK